MVDLKKYLMKLLISRCFMDKGQYEVYEIMQYLFNEMIKHKRMAES